MPRLTSRIKFYHNFLSKTKEKGGNIHMSKCPSQPPARQFFLLILECTPSVVFKIALGRPEGLFGRAEDRAVGKRQHVAGHVLIRSDPPRNEDLVTCPHAHEAFVKGPVADAAESQSVRGPVIPALAPGKKLIVHLGLRDQVHDGKMKKGRVRGAVAGDYGKGLPASVFRIKFLRLITFPSPMPNSSRFVERTA
jgi:hypothetical protein